MKKTLPKNTIQSIPQCIRIVKDNRLMNVFKITLAIVGTQYLIWRDDEKNNITFNKIIEKIIVYPGKYRNPYEFINWLLVWKSEINNYPGKYKEEYKIALTKIKTTM
jgi:hypothetical protein